MNGQPRKSFAATMVRGQVTNRQRRCASLALLSATTHHPVMTTRKKNTREPTTNGGQFGTSARDEPTSLDANDARIQVLSDFARWEECRTSASQDEDHDFDWADSDDGAVQILGYAIPHLEQTRDNDDLHARFASWETERKRLANDDNPRHSDWENSDDDAVELLRQVASRIES